MYVEFLGIPRERAGLSELEVHASTLGQLLTALSTRLPRFSELMVDGRLHASIAANLNGDDFISDPDTQLAAEDRVLLLSADVGG
jgi:molybdopterin converting factor small subunit